MDPTPDHTADPELLRRSYDLVSRAVGGLSPAQLLAGTRCRGWTVQDLLLHQLLDAQRARWWRSRPRPTGNRTWTR